MELEMQQATQDFVKQDAGPLVAITAADMERGYSSSHAYTLHQG